MRTHTRVVCLVTVAALVTSACRGPQAPLDIFAKPVSLDLVLGGRTVAGAPVPPAAFRLDSALRLFSLEYIDPPPPPRRTRSTLPPEGCIENPLAVPKAVAPQTTALLVPGERKYTYKSSGTWTVGGANASETPVADTAEVEVKNAEFDLVTFTSSWQVAVTINGTTTTTSYRARNPGIVDAAVRGAPLPEQVPDEQVPRDQVPTEPAAPERPINPDEAWPEGDPFQSTVALRGKVVLPPHPARGKIDDNAQPTRGLHYGIYIEKVETTGAAPFQPPSPGMLLARFPLQVGSTFDVAASDGVTAMTYRTKIEPKLTVDACGTGIDTWTVQLTKGRVAKVDTGQTVEFTARYQLATAVGGLIVDDYTKVTGTHVGPEGIVPFEREVATTTMTEPSL